MTTDDAAMRKVTLEKFVKAHRDAVDFVREKIRAGKGDPEKQKTCTHPDFIGDLLHGPCICEECGAVIVDA